MKWINKWWVLAVLAIAFVIWWKEKRCQSEADQCRAAYTAQLPAGRTIEQQTSEQQAITAACESNGYFCRLFSAANLPNVLLVLVGIGAFYAAIRTLQVIEKQTDATAIAANAAKASAEGLVNSERAWVMLDSIRPHLDHVIGFIVQRNFKTTVRIVFRNFGRTPAWVVGQGFTFSIESKDFRPNEKYTGTIDDSFGGPLPPEPLPESWTPIIIEVTMEPEILNVEELQAVVNGDKVLILRGVVIYKDTFSESLNRRLETHVCFKLIFRSPDNRTPARWLYYAPEANRYT